MHNLAALMLPGDAFDIDSQQILGRRVAGRSMALGFVRHIEPGSSFPLISFGADQDLKLKSLLEPFLQTGASLDFHSLDYKSLRSIGALHIPDPGLSRWQLLRSGQPANSFSLTGVIHTLSTFNVIRELENIWIAPLHEWDALVCTSNAGRDVVMSVFNQIHQHLESRFSTVLKQPPVPELPVIPLASSDPFQDLLQSRNILRNQCRYKLGIDPSTFVVLFVGRLSFHSKAHPFPLYHALNRLVLENPNRSILLLECGHIFSQHIENAFVEAQSLFPMLSIMRLGGLSPASESQKHDALASADLFISLADNLQETFGISVVEAMASSLPCIVSDWNGYKDLVDNGVTGFKVPVNLSIPNNQYHDDVDISYGLGMMSYDNMIGLRSMVAVVDHDFLYRSLKRFLSNPTLLIDMGILARRRWEDTFSWSVVFNQYVDLWRELRLRRLSASNDVDSPFPAPLFQSFSGYPSTTSKVKSIFRNNDLLFMTPSSLALVMNAPFVNHLFRGKTTYIIDHLNQYGSLHQDDLIRIGFMPSQLQSVFGVLIKLGIASVQEFD